MRSHKVWIGVGVATIAVLAAVVLLSGGAGQKPEVPDEPPMPSKGAWLEHKWVVGQAVSYHLTLTEETRVAFLGANKRAVEKIDGRLTFEARIQTVNLESTPKAHLVEVRFVGVDALTWTLSGVDVGAGSEPKKIFSDRSVLVEYDDHGAILSTQHRRSAPSAFVSVTDRLLRQLQAPLVPGVATWQRKLEAGFGQATTHGERGECGADGSCRATLSRGAADYESWSFVPRRVTDGAAASATFGQTVRLAAEGFVMSNRVDETITLTKTDREVAHVVYAAELRSVGRHMIDAPGRLGELDRQRFVTRDPAEVSDAARLDALTKRVGDWSFERIASDFAKFSAAGRMPNHEKWLWKTVGLILLRPEVAAKLAELAKADGVHPKGRVLLLDVLGNAGNPEAQAAMRDVLSSDVVVAEPEYSAMVQRFLLVEEPQTETVDFLNEIYGSEEVDDNVRYGAVTALGASLARVAQRDPAAAEPHADRIAKDLGASETSVQKRALLGALSNTRMPKYEDDIRAHGDSEDARVRGAAAGAMESIPTDGAVDYLVAVVASEPDPQVQTRAVRALANRIPTDVQLVALANAVATGPLAEVNVGHLVNTVLALSRNGVSRDGLIAVLVAAEARQIRTARIRNAVIGALQTLRAATD